MHHRGGKKIFQTAYPLILASASPRRKMLLRQLGVDFQVVASGFREPAPRPGVTPREYAMANASGKALHVHQKYPDAVVLGCDTIVVLDERILGKPVDFQDALAMIRSLSGRVHQVVTACCLLLPKGQRHEFLGRSSVWIGDFDDRVLRAYVSTEEPMDKAGAYAIQGTGAFLVERVEGSYTNVVGLPVSMLTRKFIQLGIVVVEGENQ